MVQVRVTTFKPSGKFYESWNAIVTPKADTWYDISEAVRKLKAEPGPQRDLDWVIGMDNSRDDIYPIIIK